MLQRKTEFQIVTAHMLLTIIKMLLFVVFHSRLGTTNKYSFLLQKQLKV